ncbi:GNAT family N-acetyltransferase [Aeromicrobium camelliae]|uniref:GNAT family N-acetyltransferase n=1 Tax=Aeromicrobium camelliae TaxID=1538144 RepID=UPI001AA02806|nr:GNAT family N-acetyltransferase [Aeromicrobium camelliae]
MTIRRAEPADLSELAALAALTFPLACPPHLSQADMDAFVAEHLSAERFADYLADAGRAVFVAEDAGRLTGYTMAVTGEPYDPDLARLVRHRPTVELSKCYADPAAHGTGTAAALLTHTIDWAAAEGAASVWLGVNGLNQRAQRFYAKHGFAVVGERRFQVGERVEDDLVLEKPLA